MNIKKMREGTIEMAITENMEANRRTVQTHSQYVNSGIRKAWFKKLDDGQECRSLPNVTIAAVASHPIITNSHTVTNIAVDSKFEPSISEIRIKGEMGETVQVTDRVDCDIEIAGNPSCILLRNLQKCIVRCVCDLAVQQVRISHSENVELWFCARPMSILLEKCQDIKLHGVNEKSVQDFTPRPKQSGRNYAIL